MPEEIKLGFYITTVLVVLLLWKKKKASPSRLDLNGFKKRQSHKKLGAIKKVEAEVVSGKVSEEEAFKNSCVFVYKGHKYNAWQVLDLPQGASTLEIKRSLALKIKSDEPNQALYHKAYMYLAD